MVSYRQRRMIPFGIEASTDRGYFFYLCPLCQRFWVFHEYDGFGYLDDPDFKPKKAIEKLCNGDGSECIDPLKVFEYLVNQGDFVGTSSNPNDEKLIDTDEK